MPPGARSAALPEPIHPPDQTGPRDVPGLHLDGIVPGDVKRPQTSRPTDTEVGSSVSGHRPPCGDCCLPLVSAVGRTASVPPRERSAEHVGVATALGRLWLSRSRIELRRERGGEGTSADKTKSREENEQECS